jgi:hypothetical protein
MSAPGDGPPEEPCVVLPDERPGWDPLEIGGRGPGGTTSGVWDDLHQRGVGACLRDEGVPGTGTRKPSVASHPATAAAARRRTN